VALAEGIQEIREYGGSSVGSSPLKLQEKMANPPK
jgi:ethanolamine-phosphate cytidylyltransferase